MTNLELDKIFEDFSQCTALVLGDVMIDAYLWGKVERISPEAPVPIVSVSKKENRLGGAANVALNLKALGATPIICGICGQDAGGDILSALLKDNNLLDDGLIPLADRPTSTKTRVISSGQQMLRVDEEVIHDINPTEENLVFTHIQQLVETHKIDVIIFEDYNKGLLTDSLIKRVVQLAISKKIPTAVDPKKKNFLSYTNVDLFKPNLKELKEGLKVELDQVNVDQVNKAVLKLSEKLNQRIAFITLSEHGVYLKSDSFHEIVPAHKREIADVSGAGDTVISVAALCLALNTPHEILAQLSNIAGGLVCEEVGVVPINKLKLLHEAKSILC